MNIAARHIEEDPTEPDINHRPAKKRARKPLLISPDGSPPRGAAIWLAGEGVAKRRYAVLTRWTASVMKSGIGSLRTTRVAWMLRDRFDLSKGHCFATDEALAKLTSIHPSHITTALKDLEDRGLIVRDHVEKDGKFRRRIWPRLPK